MFEVDGKKLYEELSRKKLMYRFNMLGVYPYEKMLKDQIQGRNDSWAIRWYATALINDKLSLHPGRSLVYNTGMDGSGSHCDQYDGFASAISTSPIDLETSDISESKRALTAWRDYLKKVRREKILGYMFSVNKIYKFCLQRLNP